MKTLHHKPASIAKKRWAAYAAAGAATALVGSNSTEAAIHYSGDLHEQFGPHKDQIKIFSLDLPGGYFLFARGTDGLNHYSNFAGFSVHGRLSAAFRGSDRFSIYQYAVARLPVGSNISEGKFTSPRDSFHLNGILASDFASDSKWGDPGLGFVGFRFNDGFGVQYGWVRVRMSKLPQNAFTVLDYAFADAGEPISAGQRSSDKQAPSQGSLGWLAAGGVGLLAWRRSRSRNARLKDA